MKKIGAFLFVFLGLFASCSNQDALSNDSLNGSSGEMAVLAVFNGVAGSDQMDVFLNGERQNTNIEMLRYGEFLRHRIVFPGTRTLSLNVRYGNQTMSPATMELNLASGKNYSLLLADGIPLKTTLVEDDLILPRAGQFKVRFINTNTSGEVVALAHVEQQGNFFGEMDAGKITGFETFDLADYQLRFATRNGNRELHHFDFKPANQGVYTIWLTGSLLEAEKSGSASLYTVIRHP